MKMKNDKDKLFKDCGVFFAFSSEQLKKEINKLPKGTKLVSIGAGCFLLRNKLEDFKQGLKKLN